MKATDKNKVRIPSGLDRLAGHALCKVRARKLFGAPWAGRDAFAYMQITVSVFCLTDDVNENTPSRLEKTARHVEKRKCGAVERGTQQHGILLNVWSSRLDRPKRAPSVP